MTKKHEYSHAAGCIGIAAVVSGIIWVSNAVGLTDVSILGAILIASGIAAAIWYLGKPDGTQSDREQDGFDSSRFNQSEFDDLASDSLHRRMHSEEAQRLNWDLAQIDPSRAALIRDLQILCESADIASHSKNRETAESRMASVLETHSRITSEHSHLISPSVLQDINSVVRETEQVFPTEMYVRIANGHTEKAQSVKRDKTKLKYLNLAKEMLEEGIHDGRADMSILRAALRQVEAAQGAVSAGVDTDHPQIKAAVPSSRNVKGVDDRLSSGAAELPAADVQKALYDFTQSAFGNIDNEDDSLDLEAFSHTMHILRRGELSRDDVIGQSVGTRRVLRELLTQYITFMTMFPHLRFPPGFLLNSSPTSLGSDMTSYMLEHGWPYPQLLAGHFSTALNRFMSSIENAGHPEHAVLDKRYSPSSRVPCTDMVPFIVDRMSEKDIGSIKFLMRYIMDGNPGIDLGDDWLDRNIDEILSKPFENYVSFSSVRALAELRAVHILTAAFGQAGETAGLMSRMGLAGQPAWSTRLQELVRRGTLRVDDQDWREERVQFARTPPQVQMAPAVAKAIMSLSPAARLQLFYVVERGGGALPELTNYPIRRFGINVDDTSREILGSGMVKLSFSQEVVLKAYSKDDLLRLCEDHSANCRRSWSKARLLEALQDIDPDMLKNLAEARSLVSPNFRDYPELRAVADIAEMHRIGFELLFLA